MRQRCGPIQCVSIEDGSAMQESYENTHAAPKLVNRPSPHTHTHCPDPVTWATVTARRHKMVHRRGTIAQATTQKRKQNHATTRAHQKTSSQHKETVLSRVSANTSTLQRTWHDGRYLLFSTVLQPTLTRTTNVTRHGHCPRC